MVNKEYDIKELKELIAEKDVEKIKDFMDKNGLFLSNDGIIKPIETSYLSMRENQLDLEQFCKKICLNSSYGSLLNSSSTFYDFRLGTSITMAGRKVWQHLASKTNEIMSGHYIHKGYSIYTGDTDSCYATIDTPEFKEKYPDFDYSRDNMVKFADAVADAINASFSEYMIKTFHCTKEGAARAKAGREVVASRAYIAGKKRYAMMVFDQDGYRKDVDGSPGKAKIMGLQIQRNDTPKIVRKILKDMVIKLLTGGTEKDLQKMLYDFYKNQWLIQEPWSKGTPKPINKLAVYEDMIKNGQDGCIGKKATIPGQIKAALNFNKLIDYYKDTTTKKLAEGDKVYVCRLTPNNFLNMDCVAISVELGDGAIPQWFKELPFDFNKTNDIIDKTIDSIFSVLKWNLSIKTIIEEEKQNERMNNLGIDFD